MSRGDYDCGFTDISIAKACQHLGNLRLGNCGLVIAFGYLFLGICVLPFALARMSGLEVWRGVHVFSKVQGGFFLLGNVMCVHRAWIVCLIHT